MTNLLRECNRYLTETLGISVNPVAWSDAGNLPVHLQDRYMYYQVNLLGIPCLFMLDRGETNETPATIRKHVTHVQQRWGGEIIYLRGLVSAYNRKRLIDQHIPFIIPGNQIYLPPLGLDLREHFRKLRVTPIVFSPSTQAVILYVLLHQREDAYTPTLLARSLGYTSMTMTRTFEEIEGVGLGEVITKGRERVLRFLEPSKVIWEKALGYMRSPVKKKIWIRQPLPNWAGLAAGQTALARDTTIAAPTFKEYAMAAQEWLSARKRGDAIELHAPDQEPGACRLELWSYSPRLLSVGDVVDPYSLYLSLRHEDDERIEMALEEMMQARAGW